MAIRQKLFTARLFLGWVALCWLLVCVPQLAIAQGQEAPGSQLPVSQAASMVAAAILVMVLIIALIIRYNNSQRTRSKKQVAQLQAQISNLEEEARQQAEALKHANRTVKQLKASFDNRVKERTQQLEEKNYELRHTYAQLADQKRELEQYALAIGNELKAPLVSIGGFLGFLTIDLQKPERIFDDVKHIKAAHQQMTEALDNLMLFMRVGQGTLEKTPVHIDALFKDLWKHLKHPSKASTKIEVLPNLPVVDGHAEYLAEAMKQLLDNAIKYVGQVANPKIEVGYVQKEGQGAFYVRDNGPGIPTPYQKKIFKLFERLEQNVPGTGMGLTLAQRIIEWHDGQIWVQSVEGQGATFYFSLH